MWSELIAVASYFDMEIKLPPGGNLALREIYQLDTIRKVFKKHYYRTAIFHAIDSVVGRLTVCFDALKHITERFEVLCNYLEYVH